MIATTTNNSISVNPLSELALIAPPSVVLDPCGPPLGDNDEGKPHAHLHAIDPVILDMQSSDLKEH
jgi:hypothetical protein